MNIVISGVNGFVGKHLVNELTTQGHSIIGIGMEDSPPDSIANELLEYASCNLAEAWPDLKHQPDAIIHLAGLAAVGPSFDKPQDYINLNSAMMTHMCEYYLKKDKRPRVVVVSSGAIYDAAQPMPINEASKIALNSPYAVSKLLTENQAAYYNKRGLECVVVRPFNHIGPGQGLGFLLPDLANKLQSRDSQDAPIHVGNLETKRDYTDVRDVAKAYVLLATMDQEPKELVYNVCSGKSRSGQEILHTLAESMGISSPNTVVDQSLIRPNEVMDICGDASRLQNETGWKPQLEIGQTIRDFVAE